MVQIIESECIGYGICASICPKDFEIIDGKAKVKDENADCLKDATNACPRGAIIFAEEGSKNEDINTNLNQDYNQSNWMGQEAS